MNTSSFWNDIVPRAMSLYANVVFLVLWVGFFTALSVNREWLDLAWEWTGALPPALRITAWVVFTPVMTGLWIWQATWPVYLRLLGLGGIVAWTLVAVNSLFREFR